MTPIPPSHRVIRIISPAGDLLSVLPPSGSDDQFGDVDDARNGFGAGPMELRVRINCRCQTGQGRRLTLIHGGCGGDGGGGRGGAGGGAGGGYKMEMGVVIFTLFPWRTRKSFFWGDYKFRI